MWLNVKCSSWYFSFQIIGFVYKILLLVYDSQTEYRQRNNTASSIHILYICRRRSLVLLKNIQICSTRRILMMAALVLWQTRIFPMQLKECSLHRQFYGTLSEIKTLSSYLCCQFGQLRSPPRRLSLGAKNYVNYGNSIRSQYQFINHCK